MIFSVYCPVEALAVSSFPTIATFLSRIDFLQLVIRARIRRSSIGEADVPVMLLLEKTKEEVD